MKLVGATQPPTAHSASQTSSSTLPPQRVSPRVPMVTMKMPHPEPVHSARPDASLALLQAPPAAPLAPLSTLPLLSTNARLVIHSAMGALPQAIPLVKPAPQTSTQWKEQVPLVWLLVQATLLTFTSMGQLVGNAMLYVPLVLEQAALFVLAALLVSIQLRELPLVSQLAVITLPTSIWTLLHASSATPSVPPVLELEIPCAQVALLVNIQLKVLRPASQPALITQPTTSWMEQFVNNVTQSVQHVVVLTLITVTRVSTRRFLTPPPRTQSIALPLVVLDSTLMD